MKWATATSFALSFALLVLIGWHALLAPEGLPLHDEGAPEHLGMLLVAAQIPLILWEWRQWRTTLMKGAALALVLGLNASLEAHERREIRARSTPLPGSDQAVQAVLAASVQPGDSAVRAFLEKDGPVLTDEMKKLGAVQSITFAGVDPIGWDIYEIAFDKGVRHIHLFLAKDSRLLGIALVDSASGCLSSEVYACR